MNLYKFRSRKGFCVYSESGTDYGKFINLLRNSSVQFYGLTYSKDKLYGFIRSSDQQKLSDIAADNGLIAEFSEPKGIWHSLKRIRMRFGILIGLMLSLMLIGILCEHIMVIEIGGNENLTDEYIIELLDDTGLGYGDDISVVDLRLAERKILSMEEDIEWIGIRNTGSRLVVEIKEIDHIPEIERKNIPCNIVAAKDAQIKQVRVYSGMLVPMVGDTVKKGDIIISGVVETKFGSSYYVHSIAEITGVYNRKITFSQNYRDIEQVYSKTITKKAVTLFGHKLIYFSDGKVYGDYECSETEELIRLGRVVLPISYTEITYKLTEPAEVTYTKEEADSILEEKIQRYETNFISSDEMIVDKQIQRKETDDGIIVTVTYTLEGEIGKEKAVFVR